jgi:ribose-phosphate pyrophosphokinase
VPRPAFFPEATSIAPLQLITTMRRASAEKITVVVPYYGYARQDRKMTSRVPISAADIARLLESVGVDRVVAMDLHCGQIQGFFGPRVPVDNLGAASVGVDYFAARGDLVNPVVVSPDAGGVYRAKVFREGLNSKAGTDAGLAMIIKQRKRAGVIEQMDLVGEVAGCDCVIVDDMIDTAGTLCQAAELLKQKGARRVFAFASHGLFSGPAVARISKSSLEKVIVVNTIPLAANARTCTKIEQKSVAGILGEAIKRIHLRKSVSEMFSHKIAAASPAVDSQEPSLPRA